MMKLRKWSSLNKAEKLGRKNALKSTLILAIPIFFLILLLVLYTSAVFHLSFINAITHLLSYKAPLTLILFLLLQFGFPVFYYFTIRNDAVNSAYDKGIKDCSKKLAEKMLVRGEPTKVKLLKTRDGYYSDFLLKDLSGKVDYYAVLEVSHNIIVIYPKFSDEKEEDFFADISNERRNPFDFIEMEEFSSFCEVVDD